MTVEGAGRGASVIVPLFKSAGSIPELVTRLDELRVALLPRRLEVIFVDDGSPDDCVPQLRQLLPATFDSVLIRHSRNFGSFAAIRTGMAAATAEFIGVMAADLQEPPELVPAMIDALESGECAVAYGQRVSRAGDSRRSRIASGVFWTVYRRFVQPSMPEGGIDIFLCRSHVADELLKLTESNSSLVGGLVWLGFPAVSVPYTRGPRVGGGRSAWSMKRRVRYMTDSAFSFSRLPLTILGWTGVVGLVACVAAGAAVVVSRLVGNVQVPGYSALMVTVLFCTSLLLVALWIVGDLAWRTFENTKRRPEAVVRGVWPFPRDNSSNKHSPTAATSRIQRTEQP